MSPDVDHPPPANLTGLTGWAAATLVSGVIGMIACLPLGLAAIVIGLLTIRRAPRGIAREARGMAMLGVACGIASIFTSVFYLAVIQSYWEANRRAKCVANLKAIHLALTVYVSDTDSMAVPALNHLVELGLLDRRFARCPSDEGRGDSYIPLALRQDRPAEAQIAAYEPKSHHKTGGHLLFGDGRIEFVAGMEYDQRLAAALRGTSASDPPPAAGP